MDAAQEGARWLAEAWETGNPLAPFPPELAPADLPAGEAMAAALVEALGIEVCGLRLAPAPGGGWVAAPLLAPRLLRAGTPVALSTQRRPRVSAAVLGVLAAPLEEEGAAPPVFAALHPALDVAAERTRDPAPDAAHLAADLGGLGFVLLGKRYMGPLPTTLEARVGPTGTRPRPIQEQLGALVTELTAAARRWGGLPAGAVLVVAGLGGQRAVPDGEARKWSASLPPVGRITAQLG